jgi:hypothetical protein
MTICVLFSRFQFLVSLIHCFLYYVYEEQYHNLDIFFPTIYPDFVSLKKQTVDSVITLSEEQTHKKQNSLVSCEVVLGLFIMD